MHLQNNTITLSRKDNTQEPLQPKRKHRHTHKKGPIYRPARVFAASFDSTTRTEQTSFTSCGWMMSANRDLQARHWVNTVSKQGSRCCLKRIGGNLYLYVYLDAPDNAGRPPGATGMEEKKEEVAVVTWFP